MADLDANKAIREKGMEFQLGLDVQTHWVTAAQAFYNPEFTMVVFRDQTYGKNTTTGDEEFVVKNAVRLIMPSAVAAQVANMLLEVTGQAAPQNGQP